MSKLHLAILPARGAPTFYALGDSEVSIGSSPEADVPLADPELASIHARILPRDGGYVLVRESLPLLVNGLRTKAQVLKPYDLIVLGKNAIAIRPGAAPVAGSSLPQPRAGESVGLDAIRRLRAFAAQVKRREDPVTLAQQLLADVLELTGASRGTLVGFAREEDPIRVTTSVRGEFDTGEIAYSRTLVKRMSDEGRSLVVDNTHHDTELANAPSMLGGPARTAIVVPIGIGERITGALYVSGPAPRGLAAASLEVMELYANHAAGLLEAERRTLALETHLADLGELPAEDAETSLFVGAAPAIVALRKTLGKVSASNAPVLIVGETGTGKELVAREIHRLSPRARGPFVAVNCGAIPQELIASELFGHVRGAFTNAQRDRLGFFRSAEQGTLFLDELGEMPLAQQVALLRVLQEQRVTPVGSETSVPVDVRLLCATNRLLDAEVAAGRVRQDLYFRVAVITVVVPPLRDRDADILRLAHHFLRQEAKGKAGSGLRFADGALRAMRTAPWPGNVRQLEAAVKRAVLMRDGEVISETDLGLEAGAAGETSGGDVVRPLTMARDEFLRDYVRLVVKRFDGNRTAAADALLVTPRTIFKYMEE